MLRPKTRTIYKYIMPGFMIYCFTIILPLILCFGISFTNWRGGSNIQFIGFENYIKLIKDKYFWDSFLNNLTFMAAMLVFQIGLGFTFAMLISSKSIKFKEAHRTIVFLPAVLAPIVVGMIWQLVYNTNIGVIAEMMRRFGLEDSIIPWLDNPQIVIPAICIVLIWQFTGQYVVIIMAGMQNINGAVLESAAIDGASGIKKAIYIVLPQLKSTIGVCVIIAIAGCMKMFDIVYVMTGGGPGSSSMVTALYAYNTAFKMQKYAYASTLAIGIVILSLSLIVVSRILFGGKKNEA